MKPFKNLSISFYCFVNTLIFIALLAHAARFDIKNNCNITTWAAAMPGGGRQINPGGTWILEVRPNSARGSGYGVAPHTLAEFTLGQFENLDFYDISLVYGFNVPMVFNPTSLKCTGIDCTGDLNGNCPTVLKAPAGCNNPCTVFKTKEYCNAGSADCKATNYSMFLKGGCPAQFGPELCLVVVGRITQVKPGPSNLGLTQQMGGCRIWARIGCSFNVSVHGSCQTSDCGGFLQCQTYGAPPNTLAEYSLRQSHQNIYFYDIFLVDGFNVPIAFSPTSNGCTRGIRCTTDINGQCPTKLRTPRKYYKYPCTVFKTNEYCCNRGSCGSTNFSKIFKNLCPDAYSYPMDDATSTFMCNSGTNYEIVFCP
uniref:Thaumatin-like protein n=1 Tax=Quercus lobata TaxID=97700 RepID=A0A7N2N3C0_QUELO